MYIVYSGHVSIEMGLFGDIRIDPGHAFGYIDILKDQPNRQANAVAMEDTVILSMYKSHYIQMMKQNWQQLGIKQQRDLINSNYKKWFIKKTQATKV